MFVYLHGARQAIGKHVVHVAPASDPAWTSDEFKTPEGEPVTFPIVFENGRASVPENLGRYLVDQGIAHPFQRPKKLIVPRS